MRVLIDCTQITKIKAGVGVYALNLVRELIAMKPAMDIWLLVQDDDDAFFLQGPRVKVTKVPARLFRKLPMRLLLEQLYIPWLVVRYGIEVVHSLHYSFPLLPLPARKIVTIHDLTSFHLPHLHVPMKRRYYKFFIRMSRINIGSIIFVSESTRSDYLKMFPRNSSTCYVVPLGKRSDFCANLRQEDISAALKKYRIAAPYILYIGMIEPRKNLSRLVEAFGTISSKYPHHRLVIAGQKGWLHEDIFITVSKSECRSRVIFTGFVEEDDKPMIIAGADIFAYPSLYEGFGIPVLEAMACGIPVLTSNTSSLPEVAGEAAILVDPTNVSSIAEGLDRLLGDGKLQQKLSIEGKLRAAKFDWKITAQKTIRAYENAHAE